MRQWLRIVIALLLFSAQLPAQAPDWEAFHLYVGQAVEDWEVPGLAIAVVKDDEVAFSKGYGVLELGRSEPATVHSRFAIGSTTKAMTAAGLGLLVDEGKIGWDDPVIDHLSDFRLADPVVTREVTIRDLLTHRAGLPNADYLWYGKSAETSEILHRLRFLNQQTSMRSHFTYQNIMYAAAGELTATVSGMPWESFVRQRIFQTLKMNETLPRLSQTRDLTEVASPHDRVDERIAVIENASVDSVPAAGSVWSSVNDLSKWIRMLLRGGRLPSGEEFLKPETVVELFTPQVIVQKGEFYPTARLTRPHWTTYGLGWFQADYRGQKVDFHTGSIDGMVAIIGLMRDQGVGVAVLANLDHAEVRHAFMYRVFDLFMEGQPADWSTRFRKLYAEIREERRKREGEKEASRVSGTSPSLPLEAYTGTYSDALYGTVGLSLEQGKLRLSYGPGLTGVAEHWHYDTFRVHWDKRWRGDSLVTFHLGPDGKPSEVRLGASGFKASKPE